MRVFRVVFPAVVLLAGCVVGQQVSRQQQPRRPFGFEGGPVLKATMTTLRSPNGECAASQVADKWFVSACPQIGAPGMSIDDGTTPYLVSNFSGPTWGTADPSSWLVSVTHDGRALITSRTLDGTQPSIGSCRDGDCERRALAILKLPEPWSPGTYTVRYVCGFDTSKTATMTITVSDARAAR